MSTDDPRLKDPRFVNFTGKHFGLLLIVSYAGRNTSNASRWRCRCACGGEVSKGSRYLLTAKTPNCGCLDRQLAKDRATTHGRSRTREFYIWSGMKARCTNINDDGYPHYGARGVRVCERWLRSFEAFLADMGQAPSKRHTLERIDNTGDYEPANCRWATPQEQARNRPGFNRLLTFLGQTKCLSEWAEEIGVFPKTLWMRLQAGYTVERALTQPLRVRKDSTCAAANQNR